MKHFQHTAFFFFLFLFCVAPSLQAKQTKVPQMTDIILTTSGSHLLIFATLENGFTKPMIAGITNGLPVSFDFNIELEAVNSGWFDSTLLSTTITHTLQYDSLKEEYKIIFSEKKGKAETTRSLQEAKTLMAEINGFPLLKIERLTPDAPYTLKIKAIMDKNTLPFGMHYILPFTSLWDFETDWRTIEFRY